MSSHYGVLVQSITQLIKDNIANDTISVLTADDVQFLKATQNNVPPYLVWSLIAPTDEHGFGNDMYVYRARFDVWTPLDDGQFTHDTVLGELLSVVHRGTPTLSGLHVTAGWQVTPMVVRIPPQALEEDNTYRTFFDAEVRINKAA